MPLVLHPTILSPYPIYVGTLWKVEENELASIDKNTFQIGYFFAKECERDPLGSRIYGPYKTLDKAITQAEQQHKRDNWENPNDN